MFCLAYRPNRRVNPRVALPVATSLALLLSMAASPQAMATCVGAQGTTITCTDVSTIPFDNIINFSAGTSAADGNYSVKVAATVGHDGEADVTNNHIVSGYIIANATNSQYSVYGMKGQDGYGIESWELENQVGGVMSASHTGLGVVAGLYLENDSEKWTIENEGTISVVRGPITAITVNSTTGAITGKDGFGNTGTVRVAAGIYNNEEEVRDHNILNEESGVIQANGSLPPRSTRARTRSS